MAKLYNLARMTTATAGTGTITLGSAVSGYLTFALAGISNGDVIDYAIIDGANAEVGTGTYTAVGTTLTRTVTKSTNSNAAISLSGSAQVAITPRAETLNDASLFTTGTVNANRLGSGVVGSGLNYLADDSTFKTVIDHGVVAINYYTSSQTITIPTGATRCLIRMVGSGGGSAGVAGSACTGNYGHAGSGGSALQKYLTGLTAGLTLAFTLGAVGSAGTAGDNAGGNAGSTTLASGTQSISTLTCPGGNGGGNSAGSHGAASSIATGGDLNWASRRAGLSTLTNSSSTLALNAASGSDAANGWGSGGDSPVIVSSTSAVGVSGTGYGSGAGAAYAVFSGTARAGAAGLLGVLQIVWMF